MPSQMRTEADVLASVDDELAERIHAQMYPKEYVMSFCHVHRFTSLPYEVGNRACLDALNRHLADGRDDHTSYGMSWEASLEAIRQCVQRGYKEYRRRMSKHIRFRHDPDRAIARWKQTKRYREWHR